MWSKVKNNCALRLSSVEAEKLCRTGLGSVKAAKGRIAIRAERPYRLGLVSVKELSRIPQH